MHGRFMSSLACLVLAAGSASAQDEDPPATGASVEASTQAAANASAESGEASASLAQGSEINATLAKPLDSGKAEPGDEVRGRVTEDVREKGEVVVPRGSTLIGRVTRAERRRSGGDADDESPSMLGVVFDRALLPDGGEIAVNGAVAAIGAAHAATSSPSAGRARTGGAGGAGLAGTAGGAVGGVAGTAAAATGAIGSTVDSSIGATTSVASRSAGAIGGFDVGGNLRSGSRGVFGLRGLDLSTDAAAGAGGSVITSTDRTVRLDGGTQLLVVAGRTAEPGKRQAQPGAEERADKR